MRALTSTAIICAVLALVAGCGGSESGSGSEFQKVTDQVKGLKGPAREQKLAELARADGGKLTLYTSLNERAYKPLLAPFEKRYGIKTTVFSSQGEPVARRLSEEAKAGRPGADITDLVAKQLAQLAKQDLFRPYTPPAAAGLGPAVNHASWTTDRYLVFVVAWNTKRVPRGQEPKSLEDLAQPRWRGRVGLEGSNAEWYKTVRDHWIAEGRSPADADRIFEGIARNSRVAASNNVMAELLGAGEFDVVAADYKHLLGRIAADGAPIAYEPLVQPIYPIASGVGILKSAEHPAAAMLLADWALSEGQEVFKKGGYESFRNLDGLPGTKVPVDVEAFADESREWQDRYDELLRLAGHAK
jgi:iron(III) transport system substrate-binding protein